ncbi:MAG: kynureninase [Anaerolineae bacterium]|nr:kynureninase [Anaerolineae bacterium]
MESKLTTISYEAIREMDANDPLKAFREKFYVPEGVLYFDGNSLGALPKGVEARLGEAVRQEWGNGLIRSWIGAGWYDMPRRLGDKIGRLVGAKPGQVVVADSTSVNLFKVLAAALKLQVGKSVILSEPDNFPTDLYMAQGLVELLGSAHELRLKWAEEIIDAIDTQTAVVMLTHVNYRTGWMHDMKAITKRAHEMGALVIWDLAHSAGAMPVELDDVEADFAIGCGYKYLNGGPGAPAFVYVAERHQARFSQPLAGWMGHAQPFSFEWKYEPAEGISRYLAGTQAVLSMTALECGVDVMLEADLQAMREKSLVMSDLFMRLVEEQCKGYDLKLVTPTERERRGSQVCLSHPEGYAMMQALIARGVIGDFRAPDILRFGFTPLYVGYEDIWKAVGILAEILETRAWDNAAFKARAKVT